MVADRLRTAIAIGSAFIGLAACVDLFHATDFATLCVVSPDAEACLPDANLVQDGATTTMDGSVAPDAPESVCSTDQNVAFRRAARACELEISCGGAAASRPDCIAEAMRAYDCSFHSGAAQQQPGRYWTCMRDVRTCAEYNKCVFPGGVPTCASSGNLCAGDVVSTCEGAGAPARGIACDAVGRTCTQPNALASCTGTKGVACTGPSRCEGDTRIACSGVETDDGQRCDALGLTCAADTTGTPYCLAQGATCTTEGSRCVGDVAESCVAGKRTTVDCGRLGLTCTANLDPFQACADVGTCNEGCVGSTLQVCVRGKTVSVACSDLGLGACTEDAGTRPTCSPIP